jgi:large subunit ribosomal protein L29
MKVSELHDFNQEELKEKESDLREELFNLKMRHRTSGVEDPLRIRRIRKDLARVKTIQQQRNLTMEEK